MRNRVVLKDSFLFTSIYVLVVAVILFLPKGAIISAFGVPGGAASSIDFNCTGISMAFFLSDAFIIVTPTFNNMV